jgi:hypothetical protein
MSVAALPHAKLMRAIGCLGRVSLFSERRARVWDGGSAFARDSIVLYELRRIGKDGEQFSLFIMTRDRSRSADVGGTPLLTRMPPSRQTGQLLDRLEFINDGCRTCWGRATER